MKYIIVYCLLLIAGIANCQPKDISSSEILHRIEGLKSTATILYIAAHPDDENTRLITYLEKDKHYRVAYLSLTRGEGGQNLIGEEQGIALGILRTQELLAARKIDGGEQFFSTAYDFGYSKTPDETMKKWDRKKVLGDVINVMNHLQPDIIICRFPTTGEGGHGHHTASAMLAEEAFDTLVKRNGSYVPKKLFWNTFNFGSTNTTNENQLKVDVGGFNALLGKSYGEIAAEARSMHRCQAFGSERRRGEQFEYFKVLRGDTTKTDLMHGIVTDWSRFKGGEFINKKIDAIIKKFDVKDPSKSVKALIELKKEIYSVFRIHHNGILSNTVHSKISEIDELILDCAGIYIEVTNKYPVIQSVDSLRVKLNAINRSSIPCEIKTLVIAGQQDMLFSDPSQELKIQNNILLTKSYVKHSKPVSNFISNSYPIYDGLSGFPVDYSYYKKFSSSNSASIDILRPEFRPELKVIIEVQVDGNLIEVEKQLVYKFIDPSFGEIFQPVIYVNENADKLVKHEIKYDHIPTQIYYTQPDPVLNFNYVKTYQKKIGYIAGAGDKMPDILSQMGYEVTLLDEKNISTFDLSSFDAIVTGVRAYNTQKWLTDYKDKLLKYVENGGNLVIQYNTTNGLVAEIPKPYPFKLSRDRITEEESDVTILDSSVSILNFPNEIRKEDFENWIQEYGLYFPTEVDSNYKKLFSMHDTGEPSNENSVIYCDYGKGRYVYTGLSFFRELPVGVPGAVKLFVNLMEDNKPEIGKTPTFTTGEIIGDSNMEELKKHKRKKSK